MLMKEGKQEYYFRLLAFGSLVKTEEYYYYYLFCLFVLDWGGVGRVRGRERTPSRPMLRMGA